MGRHHDGEQSRRAWRMLLEVQPEDVEARRGLRDGQSGTLSTAELVGATADLREQFAEDPSSRTVYGRLLASYENLGSWAEALAATEAHLATVEHGDYLAQLYQYASMVSDRYLGSPERALELNLAGMTALADDAAFGPEVERLAALLDAWPRSCEVWRNAYEEAGPELRSDYVLLIGSLSIWVTELQVYPCTRNSIQTKRRLWPR